jgi:hypothetical protein
MASDRRPMPRRGRALRVPLLALLAAALLAAAFAAPAGAEILFDNPPAAGSEPVPSLALAETGTAELGSLLTFAGSLRTEPTVRVEVTKSGDPVAAPVTLNVYAPTSDREPGPLLARAVGSFELAAGPAAQSIEFSLPGVTLPAEAIVSVASESASLGVVLAGPPATGSDPREAEGIYRAAVAEGTTTPFAFAAEPLTWQGRQPAFTVEASAPLPAPATAPVLTPATVPTLTAAPLPTRTFRHEYTVPPSKRMTVSFPRASARIAGPGALVQVKCSGSSAARCMGTLSLSAAGTVHKAPYSISRGRRQYVVVPLGTDLDRIGGRGAARATATASTIQVGGAAVMTRRALKLK